VLPLSLNHTNNRTCVCNIANLLGYLIGALMVSIRIFPWSFPTSSFMKSALAAAGMSFVLIIWDSTSLNVTNPALKIFLGELSIACY
jgi:hypothetical protein